MRIMTKLLLGTLTVGAAMSGWGCTDGPTCGSGTIEMDGQCIAAGTPPGGSCGGNTVFDTTTGMCLPQGCTAGMPCGVCADNTTAQPQPDGTVKCIGTGGGDRACNLPLVCPQPANGKVEICGRLINSQTSELLQEDDTLPTKLKINFYDASALANGTNATALLTVAPDRCGRFTSGSGITPPNLGYVAIATDDMAGDFNTGNFVFTAVSTSGAANMIVDNVHAYATPQALVAAWGHDLIAMGAYLGIYLDSSKTPGAGSPFDGVPVAHVKLTVDDNVADPGFYFSDTDVLTHSMIDDAATETGVNGAGVLVLGPLSLNYGGIGSGASASCTFPTGAAKTLPNALFVQEHVGTCP